MSRSERHSGPFVERPADRDLLADAQGKYGPCPLGLCWFATSTDQLALPLFEAAAPGPGSTIAAPGRVMRPEPREGWGEASG